MERLRTKAMDESPAHYLTLVTLIQSVALAFFMQIVEPGKLVGGDASVIYWLKCLATFQVLVIVWHEYMVGTILYKWVLSHFDVAIPFILAICEYGLISTLNLATPFFLMWMLAFTIVGLAAHANQYVRAKGEPENDSTFSLIRPWRHGIIFALELLSLLLFFYFLWLACKEPANASVLTLILALSNCMLSFYATTGHILIWRKAFLR